MIWVALGFSLIATLLIMSVVHGSTPISLQTTLQAFGQLFTTNENTMGPVYGIVVDLRLPRALLAILVGAGLGVVGTLLQTTTKNNLADPFLFGLSSGAAA
ncbi:iron chelate uptake ABC transporter family permease subunit, partial [Vibrio harveyi]